MVKKKIRKYLVEFIVIFLGITASFLVDEWRTKRDNDQYRSKLMRESLRDLTTMNEAWTAQYDPLIDKRVALNFSLAYEDFMPDSVLVEALNFQGRGFTEAMVNSTLLLADSENRRLIENENLLGGVRNLKAFIAEYNDQQTLIDSYYSQYIYPIIVQYDVQFVIARQNEWFVAHGTQLKGGREGRVTDLLHSDEFKRNVVAVLPSVNKRENHYSELKSIMYEIRLELEKELK